MARSERARARALAAALCSATAAGGCDDPAPPGPRPPPTPPDGVDLPPRAGASPVEFVDATGEAGVTFLHDNGHGGGGWHYVESLGSGVVILDADGDGDSDLFFPNGRRLSGPAQDPPPRNAYFRNDGTGRFTDATDESGLGDARYSMGACAGDCDNDGDLDLYVTNFDEANALYRNDGSGRFEDVAAAAGASGRPDAVDGACAFADIDGDGWLDLWVGGCLDHTRANNRECWDAPVGRREERVRRYCNPVDYRPLPDLVLRNRGDGTFEDFTRAAGVADLLGRTLGLAFCDFDDDRDPDLFVACDRSRNLLLENDGTGRFVDRAPAAGVASGPDGREQAGMGATTGDLDGDGRMDLVVTYFEREWNALHRQVEPFLFEDEARASGTAHHSYLPLGWGTELFDADLDGRLDWLVANGHLQPNLEKLRAPLVGYAQPMLFFLNRGGGAFESLGEQAGAAIVQPRVARGLATADVDGDGDLDVAISSNHSPATLLRNDSPRAGRHWLLVRTAGAMRPGAPRGAGSNRDGIGARVVARAGGRELHREIHSGQSYYSQSDLRAHFGLGEAAVVDLLEIRWPSGRTSRHEDVAADQVFVAVEPEE